MSSYTQLMALSTKQTQAADAAAAMAAAQLQRKEEAQRKARAAREAKEREREILLRKQRLEAERREEERLARKEQERLAKDKLLEARLEQQRNALLYGPKKAKPDARQRESTRTGRPSRSSESPEPNSGPVLTREELREQKRLAEMRRTYSEPSSSSKRSSGSAKRRTNKEHMPGGALPIVTTTVGLPADLTSMPGNSVKEKIAAVPLTLTKLNINKRDVRTIDEILRDRERERQTNKVISGAEAKEFSDWFTKSKKKESPRKITPPRAPGNLSAPEFSQRSQSSASSSRSNSVPVPAPSGNTVQTVTIKKQPPKPIPASQPAKPQASPLPPTAKSAASIPAKPIAKATTAASQPMTKKRPRSPSLSPEPPAKRRATASGSTASRSYLPDDVFTLITGGRSRNAYAVDDDGSDSSDMEADAAFQEREERISARAAKKEDEMAAQELARLQEEKRRKRLQREREVMFRKK